MRQADCGVFLSRSEGWNLPALEMLSCGKQVIITNYSGHTEYCDSSNAHLVNIDTLEDAHDGRWFFGQGQWAALGERQLDQAIEHLRAVHRTRQEGRLGVNQAGIETAKRFTWDSCATRILDVVHEVEARV
jgi:glycosyltransferase involved in cell wall biosynthesis